MPDTRRNVDVIEDRFGSLRLPLGVDTLSSIAVAQLHLIARQTDLLEEIAKTMADNTALVRELYEIEAAKFRR